MANHPFGPERIPDLHGKVFVVTGANSGLGFEATRMLARHGAHVVMGCRDLALAEDAAERIRSEAPAARLSVMRLDLADLASVRDFAEEVSEAHPAVDVLINNAGVMALPHRLTKDGFEMQLGVNHLGHFALTGRLAKNLLAVPGARVVTVGSHAHRTGRIPFGDLQGTRRYQKWLAYSNSKLANLLFAYELDRRARRAAKSLVSVVAHPGYAATNLQAKGPIMAGSKAELRLGEVLNRFVAQDQRTGALPEVYAAVAPEVRGGEYYGPSGRFQVAGPPKRVESSARSHDPVLASRLWDVSVELTGVAFPF
jgi:NAD(P)-dependent dehydrogenase (short-subunit alcohol dehydrogenase family)